MVEAGVGLNIACPSLLPPLHPAGAHGGLSPYVLDRESLTNLELTLGQCSLKAGLGGCLKGIHDLET